MTVPRLTQLLEPLEGQEVPGGCATCDAYQVAHRDPQLLAVWHVTVHHDDDCPTYRAMAGA